MPNWLSWIIAIIRSVLGIEADIKQKQEEHVGEVIQRNSDLQADLTELRAEDAAARDTPHGKQETIEALKHGDL